MKSDWKIVFYLDTCNNLLIMKKIVCYGDSNTFGFNSKDGLRYGDDVCWTSLLEKNLKGEYEVINEGTCNRTGFVENPEGDLFSALKHFPKMLSLIDYIDILILAIGTNDLQFQYNIKTSQIENGLKNLIELAQQKTKNIIIIPPVDLDERILEGPFNIYFDKTSIEKSAKTKSIFKTIANKYDCKYFDINEFTKPYDFDGLHYDENSHKLIAQKLADFINKNI